MLRLRRDRRGPFAGLDLELPPHTHTGPLPQRLYSARYDVLSYSDDRRFFINGAAFIDTDGHIEIQRKGKGSRKVLSFYQKNQPFLDAFAVQISRRVPGVKINQTFKHKTSHVCHLTYTGRQAERILRAFEPFIYWKHQKALWISLETTVANQDSYDLSHDYSTNQLNVDLTAQGGRNGPVNDWGFRGSTQLNQTQYLAHASICFQSDSDLACWLAAAHDFDGYWSNGGSADSSSITWKHGLVQKNAPALEALNKRCVHFKFPSGGVYRVDSKPRKPLFVAACTTYGLVWTGKKTIIMARVLYPFAILKQCKARWLSAMSIRHGDLAISVEGHAISVEYTATGTQTRTVTLPAIRVMRLGPARHGVVLPMFVTTIMNWKDPTQGEADEEVNDDGDPFGIDGNGEDPDDPLNVSAAAATAAAAAAARARVSDGNERRVSPRHGGGGGGGGE